VSILLESPGGDSVDQCDCQNKESIIKGNVNEYVQRAIAQQKKAPDNGKDDIPYRNMHVTIL
jgi:hypothetical protein